MHSLSFPTASPASPASPPPGPDPAAGNRGTAHFAALLDALAGAAVAQHGGADTIPAPAPTDAVSPGTGLPGAATAGRFLPENLPLAGDGPAEGSEDAPVPADIATAVAIALLPGLPAPSALAAPAAAPATEPTVPRGPVPGRGDRSASAAPPANIGSVTLAMGAMPAEPAAPTPVAEATECSLRTMVAAAAGGAQGKAAGGEGRPDHRAGDQTTRTPADLSALPLRESPATATAAAPAFTAPGAPAATPPASAAAPASLDPLNDLAAIVDRLAAARGALAPAAASLALDHAEFGALTLRFEQQQDGRLLVGLSAQDAEAQRAVAAALATERNPSFGGERTGSDSQQHGHGGRGGGAAASSERGAGGGGQQAQDGHARRDPARHNPPAVPRRPPSSADSRHGGIFA